MNKELCVHQGEIISLVINFNHFIKHGEESLDNDLLSREIKFFTAAELPLEKSVAHILSKDTKVAGSIKEWFEYLQEQGCASLELLCDHPWPYRDNDDDTSENFDLIWVIRGKYADGTLNAWLRLSEDLDLNLLAPGTHIRDLVNEPGYAFIGAPIKNDPDIIISQDYEKIEKDLIGKIKEIRATFSESKDYTIRREAPFTNGAEGLVARFSSDIKDETVCLPSDYPLKKRQALYGGMSSIGFPSYSPYELNDPFMDDREVVSGLAYKLIGAIASS